VEVGTEEIDEEEEEEGGFFSLSFLLLDFVY